MTTYDRLFDALRAVQKQEACGGIEKALLALGLRALLAAIGNNPEYREQYVAKGGTILRLRSNAALGRFSTDLDLSGLNVGLAAPTAEDHLIFAANLGRSATKILQSAYKRGSADINVSFDPDTLGQSHDESDPDTINYRIKVSAALNPGKKATQASDNTYKIDLTCDEDVDLDLIEDLRITSYGIPIDVRAYAPLQSIAEKMRAILQKRRHYERKKSTGNLVPRHLFDLAPLYRMVAPEELSRLPDLFRRKCACRKIEIDGQTRSWLLDKRLFEAAKEMDVRRAEESWRVLHDLVEAAQIP